MQRHEDGSALHVRRRVLGVEIRAVDCLSYMILILSAFFTLYHSLPLRCRLPFVNVPRMTLGECYRKHFAKPL